MKKVLILSVVALFTIGFAFSTSVLGADIELAKKSTIEKILKRGELRVGFESGYVPFEMTDKKGNFIGFDMDFARRMAKEMGVKFV
ncbi:MAG: transporter substrate-binding domain-containing protein, partial [Desulfobacterales bacterium]